jgi:transposase
MAIKKNRTLTYDDVQAIIMDVTEQPVERPCRKKRYYYTGKKRRHTLKTEIRIDQDGKILNVSKCCGGRTHDFKLHKKGAPLPHKTRIYADSGYQGLKKLHKFAATPYKKRRRRPLTYWEKLYNHILRKRRIKVEHTFAQLKKFRILAERYRNKLRHNLKFNIVAGITNLMNGFTNDKVDLLRKLEVV